MDVMICLLRSALRLVTWRPLKYYGAVYRRASTYSFSPSSIGGALKARNQMTGGEIDLPDYGVVDGRVNDVRPSLSLLARLLSGKRLPAGNR